METDCREHVVAELDYCVAFDVNAHSAPNMGFEGLKNIETDVFDVNAYSTANLYLDGQHGLKNMESDVARLPANQQVSWRTNSGLSDGSLDHVDLTGGYYDAGDNVSTLEYGKRMGPQLQDARAAIRWATDYLLKCARAKPGKLYVGVGDPNVDHKCWQRPEDMNTVRTVYSVSPSNPGSDVAGEMAAANSKKSNGDELLWGASWLLRATNDAYYYNFLKTLGANDQPDIFSWDNKYAGGYVLLSKRPLLDNDKNFEQFKQQAESFMCEILPNSPYSTTKYTQGGLMYKLPESNLQYVTFRIFLLTTYGKQVDYIPGENPIKMSFMAGFGPNFPKRIQYRGSSLPYLSRHPQSIGCDAGFEPFFYSANPNPNVLVGGVVGGQNQNDGFLDDRSDYAHSEPATYINAAFFGPLAYFAH
ncbi:Endoglucanase 3 [Hibiscus syriacus]|uniref:Endoglucanase n=1 Tax=Hibiscus syriacus TaxID=106335 RepID=A0A6A2YZQ6_HIBSY|nr:Endoglucanase 3 [Hibiscus syriacus]